MFAQLNSRRSTGDRKILASSLVLHGLLFAWLLHTPEPQLLNPTSVALGHNGKLVTRIYFPTPTPDDSTTSSPAHATEVYRHQRLGHEKLILKQNTALAKLPPPQVPLTPSSAEDKSKTPTVSNLGHGAPAGLPYGSLPGGPVYGDEVRPALPVATADPAIYPWQRPDSEGKVVIEITIDERGEIIRKTVLQSLGPMIDEKCLAALESWHFRPATRNGVPIPSKQDAIFPFKARG
ncbi:MAG TPA: TonB family protein [Candidatus Deferrimicrobiaceae bacterium]|jgi:TonB family protein|nr:TonB family protein [Candidatus Deferrimicrobiaceae bacterium]